MITKFNIGDKVSYVSGAAVADVCNAVDREMKLREQVKDYEQALDFYGNQSSWDWYVTCQESENLHISKEDCEDFISIEIDSKGEEYQNNIGSFGGKKAREVLKKWRKNE